MSPSVRPFDVSSREAPSGDPGLPRFTLPVSLVGLVVLVVSTLPALVAKRRLERTEQRLEREVDDMERAAERIRRDRTALRSDEYVLDRAMRDLFDPGPRVAVPPASRAP